MEKVQIWGMPTLERQGKTQIHSHLFPNVCLPPEEKNTKLLALTGPRFPISGHFGPSQRGLFGKHLCREWSRGQVGSPRCPTASASSAGILPWSHGPSLPTGSNWSNWALQQELFLPTAQVPAACCRSRCLCCVSRA